MGTNSRGIYFNPTAGQTSYIKLGSSANIPSIRGLANFTWAAYVKPDISRTSTLVQRLYCERQTGTVANTIRFGALAGKDRLRFELAVKDGDNKTNYDYITDWDDRWHHVAFVGKITGSSPTYEIMFDGIKVADGTLRKHSGVDEVSNTAPRGDTCYLGNVSYHGTGSEIFLTGNQWYGKVDEIAVFKEAVSQTDIQTYVSSRDTWALGNPDLISYWQFDETSGTTTSDSDNPTWNGTLILDGSTSTSLRVTDRPFMGAGVLDTTPPATVTTPATDTDNVSTDGFVMHVNIPSDQTQSGAAGINVQKMEYQVDTSSAMTSYTSYTVPIAFSTSATLALGISELLPNTNYYWRARALDEALNPSADWVSPILVTTLTALTTPKPPLGVQTQNISYDSFDIVITPDPHDTETPPGSITIAGYKVDVSFDSRFKTYKSGWKNNDVGAATTVTVSGLNELSSYFVRVRQYTADGTESISSPIIPTFTSSAPDTSKPVPVTANDATSVDARAATANWTEGVDDIGVTGYYIDVATDAGFANMITTYLDVGNVISYRITGLTPGTLYYYRLYARDAAGNVSEEGTSAQFTTTVVGIEDGGNITVEFTAIQDSFTDSLSTSAIHGADNVVSVVGSGAAAVRYGWLQFDLSNIQSNFVAANLYIYVKGNSAATINARVSNSVTFDETTLNWSNQPSVATTATTFIAPTLSSWVSIDLTPYFTTPGIYVVRFDTNSTDDLQFSTKEGAANVATDYYAPYLALEYDPNQMIKADEIIISAGPNVYRNYAVNPSGRSGVTTGWTATANNTLTIDATNGRDGAQAFKNVMTSGATNPIGMSHNNTIAATVGDVVVATGFAKSLSADATVKVYCQGLDVASAVVSTTIVTSLAKTGDYVPVLGYYSVSDPTVTQVKVFFGGTQSTAQTIFFDDIVISKETLLNNPGLMVSPGAFYDGSRGGYSGFWGGTAEATTSTRYGASMNVRGTYLGDSNTNAYAHALFKRHVDEDWIAPYQQVTMYGNSTLNDFYVLIGPTVGYYNQIKNGSFEVNTNGYTAVTNGGSSVLTKDDNFARYGVSSGKVVVNATADAGIKSQKVYTGTFTDVDVHGRASILAPAGSTIKAVIKAFNSSNVLIGTSAAVTGVNQILGNDQWQDAEVVYTLPAGAYSYELHVLQSTAIAATWYVDGVLMGDGSFVNPYRDGTFEDAYFESTAHDSVTSLFIEPNTLYDVKVIFHDDDGIVDGVGNETEISTTFKTGVPPDYRTIINEVTDPLITTSDEDTVTVVFPYQGDDPHDDDPLGLNQMIAKVEYKRADQIDWTLTAHTIDRVTKKIRAVVQNLNPGTLYNFRITITDTDGVSGLSGGIKTFDATTTYFGENISTPSNITFGGYVLHDETKGGTIKTFVTYHDAFGFPDRRIDSQEIPKSDGAIELSALWGSRQIKMRGIVYGDSRNETLEAVDQLKHGLLNRQRPLIINTFSNMNRKYFATCSALSIEEEAGINYRHLAWEATFDCADPFAYSANTITNGPTQAQLNGSTITYTNAGGLEVYPKFTISTKSSSRITVSILNTLTGERLVSGLGMITDDVMTIDCAASSVQMNGVEIGYSGVFPRFFTGDNQIAFNAERGPTTANVYVTTQWVERYI